MYLGGKEEKTVTLRSDQEKPSADKEKHENIGEVSRFKLQTTTVVVPY